MGNWQGSLQGNVPEQAEQAEKTVEPAKPKAEAAPPSKYVVTVTEKDSTETRYEMSVQSQTREATIKQIVQFHPKTRRLEPAFEGEDFSKVTQGRSKEKVLDAVFVKAENFCKVEKFNPAKHGNLPLIKLDSGVGINFTGADKEDLKSERYEYIQGKIREVRDKAERERLKKVKAQEKQSEADLKAFDLEQHRKLKSAGSTEKEIKAWHEKTKKRSRPAADDGKEAKEAKKLKESGGGKEAKDATKLKE